MRRSLLLFPALLLGCGTDVSGPSGALLACVFDEATRPEVGDVLQVSGGGNQEICLTAGGEADAAFAYISFFATAAPGPDQPAVVIDVDVLGGSFAPPANRAAAEHPGAVLLPAAGEQSAPGGAAQRALPVRDDAFHDWLRQREIRELTPLLRGGAGPAPPQATGAPGRGGIAADVPEVGDLLDFNVAISCSASDIRTGRVSHISDRAIIVQDVANPGTIGSTDLEFFGETFDTLVYPVETAHFGAPVDIDDNERAILFFTRAVNERNTAGADFLTLGFFWSGDLFPEQDTERLQACPAGNEAEMFYLIAPDPDGVVGPELEVDDLRALAIPLIGHEFQHLINASRRMFVNEAVTFEEPWLNEGLSHAAEELLFYQAAGLQPLMNLTADDIRSAPNGVAAFNVYMGGNLTNLRHYLSDPDSASLMGIDALATRGATWAFLRYAADRLDQGDDAFFFDLVNSQVAGLENLAGVVGDAERPLDWMHDWTVSVYGDDFVPGLAARYRQRSWDLRDVYEESTFGQYPLTTISLGLHQTLRVQLQAGGAAYTAFGVAGGERAVVHVEAAGQRPPAALRGSVVRVQ